MRNSLDCIKNGVFVTVLDAGGIFRRNISSHISKHFLASIATFLGLLWGPLFGNAIVVEYLFAIPGIGNLFIYTVL